MAVQTGHSVRPAAPVVTWLLAPALVALGIVLALAAVVALAVGMAPVALAALAGLVGTVSGFWTVLARRAS